MSARLERCGQRYGAKLSPQAAKTSQGIAPRIPRGASLMLRHCRCRLAELIERRRACRAWQSTNGKTCVSE